MNYLNFMKKFPQIITYILFFIFLIWVFIPLFIYAYNASFVLKTPPLDGTFQIYNALHRIDLGQIIGKDFPFFHGVGTLLLHKPLFFLFGKNIAATEISKNISNILLFFFSTFLFFKALKINWKYNLLSIALLILFLVSKNSPLIFSNHNTIGVRTFFPIISIALLLLFSQQKKFFTHFRYFILLAILNAITLFISTEQGMAFGAVSILHLFFFSSQKISLKEKFIHFFDFILVTILSFLTLITIFTSFDSIGFILKFNFIDLPSDQFWYFGSPPHEIIQNIFLFPFKHFDLFKNYLYTLMLLSFWGYIFYFSHTGVFKNFAI